MENDYASYELALALKKSGFDEPCDRYYSKEDAPDGQVWILPCLLQDSNNHFMKRYISAPTLAQAQKWLREVKGIYAYPGINALKKWFARVVDLKNNEELLMDGAMFNTYEEAQSHAISYALQLLDNEKQ